MMFVVTMGDNPNYYDIIIVSCHSPSILYRVSGWGTPVSSIYREASKFVGILSYTFIFHDCILRGKALFMIVIDLIKRRKSKGLSLCQPWFVWNSWHKSSNLTVVCSFLDFKGIHITVFVLVDILSYYVFKNTPLPSSLRLGVFHPFKLQPTRQLTSDHVTGDEILPIYIPIPYIDGMGYRDYFISH